MKERRRIVVAAVSAIDAREFTGTLIVVDRTRIRLRKAR